jgi:hypothetical protein
MVRSLIDPTAYKVVARASVPAAELASDRQTHAEIVNLKEIGMVLTINAPYKGGTHPKGMGG